MWELRQVYLSSLRLTGLRFQDIVLISYKVLIHSAQQIGVPFSLYLMTCFFNPCGNDLASVPFLSFLLPLPCLTLKQLKDFEKVEVLIFISPKSTPFV